jgi:hypothetical protein
MDESSDTAHFFKRFQARFRESRVEFDWDAASEAANARWRVLRSEHAFAQGPEANEESGQTLVVETSSAYVSDADLDEHKLYFYTVFAKDERGLWQLAAHVSGKPHDRLSWWHRSAEDVMKTERGEPGRDGFHLPHKNR